MGTRNLIAAMLNNEFKIAQYCQWDGYPSGQGRTVIDFIRQKLNVEEFKKALSECVFVPYETIEGYEKALGIKVRDGMISMNDSDKFCESYPHFHRDLGAHILQAVQTGYPFVRGEDWRTKETTYWGSKAEPKPVRELKNEIKFASDSLFCEYAYVLDMDTETLEVYSGFSYLPKPKGRFKDFPVNEYKSHDGEPYYPIRLIKKYPFKWIQEQENAKAIVGAMAETIEASQSRHVKKYHTLKGEVKCKDCKDGFVKDKKCETCNMTGWVKKSVKKKAGVA